MFFFFYATPDDVVAMYLYMYTIYNYAYTHHIFTVDIHPCRARVELLVSAGKRRGLGVPSALSSYLGVFFWLISPPLSKEKR